MKQIEGQVGKKRTGGIYRWMLRRKIKRILIGVLIGLYLVWSVVLIAGTLYYGF